MADYIYLLQVRLTRAQQAALEAVRDVARTHSLTVFLVGGAVRDLTSGALVRDLDVAVQGDAVSLRKDLEAKGGLTLGSYPVMQTLHMAFPGGVRLGVESALSVSYPKPGKPVTAPATILDDLRRRDFTANAMAISLNEGSYGLLMDPLNGVADIENRELRLVSNYGFIEDPARMIRGVRLGARAGWHFEEKTQQRYDTGKTENYISAMQPNSLAYETEDIFHEEEPLRVLRRLEEEGWMESLFPALQSTKASETELERLRDLVDQLRTMDIHPDPSAAHFPLLTARMAPKDVAELKKNFARPGFVEQIDALEPATKDFATRFTAKNMAAPSDTWKLLMSSPPEQVLWLAFSSKNAGIQARFKAFFEEWPSARQRIPYGIIQEMRITSDLQGYADLIESLFFALMDGKLETPEAIREFLAPFSPPAPPPPVSVRRRPAKRESKASKSKTKVVGALRPESSEPDDKEPEDHAPSSLPPITAGAPEQTSKSASKKPDVTPEPAAKKAAGVKEPAAKSKPPVRIPTPSPGKAVAKEASVAAEAKTPTKSAPAKSVQPQKAATKIPDKKSSVPAPSKQQAPHKAAAKKVASKSSAKNAGAKAIPTAKNHAGKAATRKVAKKSRG